MFAFMVFMDELFERGINWIEQFELKSTKKQRSTGAFSCFFREDLPN